MQVWLRLLIVWFVAIALPVQGMAGVTMAHCTPEHAHTTGVPLATGPHAGQNAGLHHGHHDASGDHHHVDGVPHGCPGADDGMAAQEQLSSDTLSGIHPHKCSSCASCCAGSALPSALLHVPQVAAAPVAFAETLVSVGDHASDGPDRPPRRRLV